VKEDLKFLCEEYKVQAKQTIAKKKEIEKLKINSTEYVVQSEVFQNIIKDLVKNGEIIYTAILSYNNSPETFKQITKDDVLFCQLMQDEISSILKENGIHLNYLHPNDKK